MGQVLESCAADERVNPPATDDSAENWSQCVKDKRIEERKNKKLNQLFSQNLIFEELNHGLRTALLNELFI